MRAGKTSLGGSGPGQDLVDPRPFPSRVSGTSIAAPSVPSSGLRPRRFRRDGFPFAVPRPERFGPAGRSGKWERLQLVAFASRFFRFSPCRFLFGFILSDWPRLFRQWPCEAAFRSRSAASWPPLTDVIRALSRATGFRLWIRRIAGISGDDAPASNGSGVSAKKEGRQRPPFFSIRSYGITCR